MGSIKVKLIETREKRMDVGDSLLLGLNRQTSHRRYATSFTGPPRSKAIMATMQGVGGARRAVLPVELDISTISLVSKFRKSCMMPENMACKHCGALIARHLFASSHESVAENRNDKTCHVGNQRGVSDRTIKAAAPTCAGHSAAHTLIRKRRTGCARTYMPTRGGSDYPRTAHN